MTFELPQETIFYLLEKSMKRYRKLAQDKINASGHDISVNQLILLMHLKQQPAASQVELAELIFKDFASVARMVDLLVKKKYLNRTENTVDRRRKDLTLTNNCKKMLRELIPVVEEYRKLALQTFTQKDIKSTQSFLQQLITNCEDHTS